MSYTCQFQDQKPTTISFNAHVIDDTLVSHSGKNE